jgi:FG-GAP repeat
MRYLSTKPALFIIVFLSAALYLQRTKFRAGAESAPHPLIGESAVAQLTDPPLAQLARLTADDGAAEDRLSRSVAASGDTVVVVAASDEIGANRGIRTSGSEGRRGDTGSQSTQNVMDSRFSAPSISLPKGGGAIRGIGEKFAANPVTGTGSMTVPIAATLGSSGLAPQKRVSQASCRASASVWPGRGGMVRTDRSDRLV